MGLRHSTSDLIAGISIVIVSTALTANGSATLFVNASKSPFEVSTALTANGSATAKKDEYGLDFEFQQP